MALLLDNLFSSVAFGHFIVDVMNGQRAVLLAYLSVPLGLSNTLLGLISTIYVVSGSLTQPLFGLLADRKGPRWVVAGGVLWMAFFFALALLIPGKAALLMLIFASLGSAAFHPGGTMQATISGREHFRGRETTSAAYFFVFGQLGLFLGPMVGGPLLDRFGPAGLLSLAGLAVPVSMNAAHQLSPFRLAPSLKTAGTDHRKPPTRRSSAAVYSLIPFAMLAAFQAWSQQNIITFMPKYLSDQGLSPSTYGLVAAIFMGGSAFGNALGGNLADKFGKRRVAAISLGLAAIPFFLIGRVGWSPWLYILVPLAGGLTGAVHSIIVVLAQRILPGSMALASGLILGFMFSSGAVGTFISGFLADLWGFPLVFTMTAGIALSAAFLALSLKKDEASVHA